MDDEKTTAPIDDMPIEGDVMPEESTEASGIEYKTVEKVMEESF